MVCNSDMCMPNTKKMVAKIKRIEGTGIIVYTRRMLTECLFANDGTHMKIWC